MMPLPPLNLAGGHSAGGTAGGSGSWSTGDWNVNVGGSAPSMQAGGNSLLMIALVVGAAWLLLRK